MITNNKNLLLNNSFIINLYSLVNINFNELAINLSLLQNISSIIKLLINLKLLMIINFKELNSHITMKILINLIIKFMLG